MELASKLGWFNVDAMLATGSSKQLTEWRAFCNLNPMGEWRADLRSGIIAQLLANINRNPKTKPEPFSVSDFMPDFIKPYITDEEEEAKKKQVTLKDKILAMAAAFNARVIKKEKK